jgi:flagellar biosynthesis protein FlhB
MKKVLPIAKFPHKTFAVIAVVLLVAYLFSMKPVAEFVKKIVESVGIKFPAVETFQDANNNVMYAAAGALLLLVGFAIISPVVKVALIVVGASFVIYSGYKLIQNFFPNFMGGSNLDRGN